MKRKATHSPPRFARPGLWLDRQLARMGQILEACEWFPAARQGSIPPSPSPRREETVDLVMERQETPVCIELPS